MRKLAKSAAAALCGFALLSIAGCGKVDPTSRLAELNRTNVQRMSNLYLAFQMENAFYGPRNESDLRGFVEGLHPDKLARIGVEASQIDALFVSERDGQPFQIRYGVRGHVMGSNEPVVFEAEGEDGMRQVGFLNSTSREVDSSEYDRLWSQGAQGLAAG